MLCTVDKDLLLADRCREECFLATDNTLVNETDWAVVNLTAYRHHYVMSHSNKRDIQPIEITFVEGHWTELYYNNLFSTDLKEIGLLD